MSIFRLYIICIKSNTKFKTSNTKKISKRAQTCETSRPSPPCASGCPRAARSCSPPWYSCQTIESSSSYWSSTSRWPSSRPHRHLRPPSRPKKWPSRWPCQTQNGSCSSTASIRFQSDDRSCCERARACIHISNSCISKRSSANLLFFLFYFFFWKKKFFSSKFRNEKLWCRGVSFTREFELEPRSSLATTVSGARNTFSLFCDRLSDVYVVQNSNLFNSPSLVAKETNIIIFIIFFFLSLSHSLVCLLQCGAQ